MAFKITITQVTREQVKNREYVETGQDDDGKPEYGYVNNETTEDVTREVYSQRTEDLDLVAVINAVNATKEN